MTWTNSPKFLLGPGLGLGLSLFAPGLTALETDQKQPVFIEADSVELDEQNSRSLYQGQVEIQQGSMKLLADKVNVLHGENRKAKHIHAVGNPAHFLQKLEGQQGEVNAQAQQIEYDATSELLSLSGQAQLTRGKDLFASDRILYDRKAGVVKGGKSAEGKKRVKISIDPNQPHK